MLWPVWLEELRILSLPPVQSVHRTGCTPAFDCPGDMASGGGTSVPVAAGQDSEARPVVSTPLVGGRSGPVQGRSTASAAGVPTSPAVSGLRGSTRAVDTVGQPSSVRMWAGRCFHCHGGLKVTVKKWADGRDKCQVTPYDPSPPDRSRSRSPTPVISPVRSGSGGEGVGGEQTLLDGASDTGDMVAQSSLPDGQDTRLLDLFGGQ